ncbi:MAG TPA: roadblock/LC7 domain-containing protein [Accumulibacter sp.]|jgi:hypothetical protein|nr:roadblock/LC7 domain-containing protein [Accumulibacter sp.]HQC81183.1 roadblock/LC7 domain-containing protein [Accumulibacter sp.]
MLEILSDSYLCVTPYGAWRAVASAEDSVERRVLQAILREPVSPLLTLEAARLWTGEATDEPALEQLLQLQEHACLEAWSTPRAARLESLELSLPPLLATLSDAHQAVLADRMGFCLAVAGYPMDQGEALAALGADILSVADRQTIALSKLGDQLLDGWGNVDAAGISGLSFWPMHVGGIRLALAVRGRPRFNQQNFADLVWSLCVRYGQI